MLRWMDSFDHYASADITEKYDAITGSTAPAITSTARFGGGALQLNDANTQATVLKVLDNQPTWVVGFAFRYTMSGGNKQIFTFRDNTTVQLTLNYATGTRFLYLSGPFGTASSSGGDLLSDGTWYYIEAKFLFANAGTYEIRVDGNTWISGAGDTIASAGAYANRFQFEAGGSGGTSTARIYDDFYLLDGTVGAGTNPMNDFLGDVRVEALRPNADGAFSQLVGHDADQVNNWDNVNDTTPDDDTTYNQSSDVGDKDLYGMTNLTTPSGTVFGIQPIMSAKKDDAGFRSIASVIRADGTTTEEDGPTHSLSSTYRYYADQREVDPDGADWTIASINAMQAGAKVAA